jgi:Na+:H+ antiporter, NhaA family
LEFINIEIAKGLTNIVGEGKVGYKLIISPMKRRKILNSFREFLKTEQSSGIILLICTILALVISNSPLAPSYFHILHFKTGPESLGLNLGISHWINDGLMAVFFLFVGLEIKRQLIEGELSSLNKSILPVIAAAGGMICPAIIYSLINISSPATSQGWGIPMATDIAFAIAILSILGNRVPFSLKILLTALAIADDLGAILVIAIFYSSNIDFLYLLFTGGIFALLLATNKLGLRFTPFYILTGLVLWYCTFRSGVHASISGVLLAFTLPLGKDKIDSVAEIVEHVINKPVNYVIMPVFALANTGFVFDLPVTEVVRSSAAIGVFFGLYIGKALGIFSFSWVAIRLKIAAMPKNAGWSQVMGVGFLGGIGFTMSIFITLLAFADPSLQTICKMSILAASVTAGFTGFMLLKSADNSNRNLKTEKTR